MTQVIYRDIEGGGKYFMLLNYINSQNHVNWLDSSGKTGFGKCFPLATTMSKGLHWSSVGAQSQLRCLQDLENIILRGVKPSHPHTAKPLKAHIATSCSCDTGEVLNSTR